MNRNSQLAQQQIAVAQRRLAAARIPGGARQGALGRQMQAPQMPVPQGADQGALAGCGPDGSCASGYIPSPFAGMPYNVDSSYLQPNALLGIFVQPVTASPTTLEISCGNTFFNACGARSFTPANAILLTSIVSGFDTRDQLCPGSGIDVAFFQTDQCYCPFDFGCFSNLAPLLITFDPIDTGSSELQPLNMILVGDRLEFGGCFPFPPGFPGGNWLPPNVPGGPQMVAPQGPVVNPAGYSRGGW